jgi:hypothetical protein
MFHRPDAIGSVHSGLAQSAGFGHVPGRMREWMQHCRLRLGGYGGNISIGPGIKEELLVNANLWSHQTAKQRMGDTEYPQRCLPIRCTAKSRRSDPIRSCPRARTETGARKIEATRTIQAGIRALQKTVTKIAISSSSSPPRVLVGRGFVEVKVVGRTVEVE